VSYLETHNILYDQQDQLDKPSTHQSTADIPSALFRFKLTHKNCVCITFSSTQNTRQNYRDHSGCFHHINSNLDYVQRIVITEVLLHVRY
jgi:hypothetical protein